MYATDEDSISLAGNGKLGPGLSGAVDAMLYQLSTTVTDFKGILTEINALSNDGTTCQTAADCGEGQNCDDGLCVRDMSEDTEFIDEFQNQIIAMQADVDDMGATVFNIRNIFTLAVIAVPIVISFIPLIASWLNIPYLACCTAITLTPFLIIVWTNFGLHAMLAVLIADLCTEFDLVLHTAPGQAKSLFETLKAGVPGLKGVLTVTHQKDELIGVHDELLVLNQETHSLDFQGPGRQVAA